MINQLEKLCDSYNQTHKNQLTVENQLMPHISVPLTVFEGADIDQTFKAMASFFENMTYAHLDIQMTERMLS